MTLAEVKAEAEERKERRRVKKVLQYTVSHSSPLQLLRKHYERLAQVGDSSEKLSRRPLFSLVPLFE